jgi:hypothetical protein
LKNTTVLAIQFRIFESDFVILGISHKKPQGEQLDHAIPVKNEETGMWQCAFCMKNDFPDLSEVRNLFLLE